MDQKLNSSTLLVCGPPSSGKDTLTDWLTRMDHRYCHFQKHRGLDEKVPNNSASLQYINITITEFKNLIEQDEFIQYHKRYGRYYGISATVLEETIQDGKIPVIHVGRIENLHIIKNRMDSPAVRLLIWAPLNVLKERLSLRHPGDKEEIERRIEAAIEEYKDFKQIDLKNTFDIFFKNDYQSIETAGHELMKMLANPVAFKEEANEFRQYIARFHE